MAETKKLWPIFSKIESRDDALQTLRNAALFFYVLAGAYAATIAKVQQFMSLGNMVSSSAIIFIAVNMLIYAAGAFFLTRFKSRSVAGVLFYISVFNIVNALVSILQGETKAEITLTKIIQLLGLWSSIRAVEATFKLHSRFVILKP